MKTGIPDSDETRQLKAILYAMVVMSLIGGVSCVGGCYIENLTAIKAIEKGLVEQPVQGGRSVWVEKDQYSPEKID